MSDRAFMRAVFRGECPCLACTRARAVGMNTISLGLVSAILPRSRT